MAIGRFPQMSLANARAAALDMIRAAQDGAHARERAARAPCTVTYAELVERYTEKHLKVNARSWRKINRGLIGPRMTPFLNRPVASIARREIIELCYEIVAAGSPQAAVNHLRYLKMLFNWAAGRDMIVNNPCIGIKPPARTVERDRVLTNSEIAAIWQASFRLPTPYREMYRSVVGSLGLSSNARNGSEAATSSLARNEWKSGMGSVDVLSTLPSITAGQGRLAQQRADNLFDDHGFGIDLIQVAVPVVEAIILVETVLVPEIIRNLVVAPSAAEITVVPLAHIEELLGLAGREATVVSFRQSGRAAATSV